MAKKAKPTKAKAKPKSTEPRIAGCITCGGAVEGYKCDMCGEEMMEPDAEHGCGARHCMPTCTGCGQSQTLCNC